MQSDAPAGRMTVSHSVKSSLYPPASATGRGVPGVASYPHFVYSLGISHNI